MGPEMIARIETLIRNCAGAAEDDYKPLAVALSTLLSEWKELGKENADLKTNAEYINKGWHASIERAESAERSLAEASEKIADLDHLYGQGMHDILRLESKRDTARETLRKVVEALRLAMTWMRAAGAGNGPHDTMTSLHRDIDQCEAALAAAKWEE